MVEDLFTIQFATRKIIGSHPIGPIVLLLFLSTTGFSQHVGKVISIADGDTFTMMVNQQQIRVRLHGIDCPEKGQDFSTVAKDSLANCIFGKEVTVKEMDTDRYGRMIGMVTINGININEKLLEEGLAWHYKTYDKNPAWAALETNARTGKIGLWSIPNPIPPWEYRKGVR